MGACVADGDGTLAPGGETIDHDAARASASAVQGPGRNDDFGMEAATISGGAVEEKQDGTVIGEAAPIGAVMGGGANVEMFSGPEGPPLLQQKPIAPTGDQDQDAVAGAQGGEIGVGRDQGVGRGGGDGEQQAECDRGEAGEARFGAQQAEER